MAAAAGLGMAAATRINAPRKPVRAVAAKDHTDAPPKLRYFDKDKPEHLELGAGARPSLVTEDDDEPAPDPVPPPWGDK
jgi:hypothetical protein